MKYKKVSERIVILKLKIDSKTKLAIIQVYAPTAKAVAEERENFFGGFRKNIGRGKRILRINNGGF